MKRRVVDVVPSVWDGGGTRNVCGCGQVWVRDIGEDPDVRARSMCECKLVPRKAGGYFVRAGALCSSRAYNEGRREKGFETGVPFVICR